MESHSRTRGHLCLWQPEDRILAVGDALSDYDVGWVNVALVGPRTAATALASLQRLADLGPALVLPAQLPALPDAALQAAYRRAKRLVDDPDGAGWYFARRVFACALMIYDGIPAEDLDHYLRARAWVNDAAQLLRLSQDDLAGELVRSMTSSSAVVISDGKVRAGAPHTPVDQLIFSVSSRGS
jgi:hypothetical protein